MLVPSVEAADEIDATLVLGNDPISSNERPDDLYTSQMELGLTFRDGAFVAGERMFTDKLAGHRFDETYVTFAMRPWTLRGWRVGLAAGALRTGKGLFGQDAQNRVHKAVGSEEVVLPYVDSERVFPTVEMTISRPVMVDERTRLTAHTSLYSAPGFRSWSRVDMTVGHSIGRHLELRYGAGARADLVESDLVSPYVQPAGLTAHVGVGYGSFELIWSYNDHGTESSMIALALRPKAAR